MKKIFATLIFALLFACSTADDAPIVQVENPPVAPSENSGLKYLALGDSYTIGEGVCDDCSFPQQIRDSLAVSLPEPNLNAQVIAQTGWTTTNLLNAITAANLTPDYDLVTLLIGVNNQYQQLPFIDYQQEFMQLVNKAIFLAGGDASKVIVVSIPDYAFTTFGQNTSNPAQISLQIDQYNAFASQYAAQKNVEYVFITDITRQGLNDTSLVAGDGLHPSVTAYTEFVKRIRPIAQAVLED